MKRRTDISIRTQIVTDQQEEDSSSRSSPDDDDVVVRHANRVVPGALGRLDDSVYESLLSPWRNKLRKLLLAQLEREMPVLERIQRVCRSRWRDMFFQQASLAGTHTFFMIWLPMWWWFGQSAGGRSLVYGLAAGAYMTGAIKDLCCVPRPYSPPLVRLSVGNHAHEYGFPSTHSSNGVSMSLLVAELTYSSGNSLSQMARYMIYAACALFSFTIVFGRIYCGMHSIADVVAGVALGLLFWLIHVNFAESFDYWLVNGGPKQVVSTLLGLFVVLIHFYPEPAEACLCYEDAVCFLAVVVGVAGARALDGRDFAYSTPYANATDLQGLLKFWAIASAKLTIGVASILVWRIFAKALCHTILPPVFRYFSHLLVERRPYIPATKYAHYETQETLHPVPSILNLPRLERQSEAHVEPSAKAARTATTTNGLSSPDKRTRSSKRIAEKQKNGGRRKEKKIDLTGVPEDLIFAPKDADVITKAIVYSGIGWIASNTVPALFYYLGLSV